MPTRFMNPEIRRTALAAAFITLALHLAQSRDLLVDFTRPVVMASLRWLGINAIDRGEVMVVGHLHVPWTRDCAGINLLLILLALTVWVNRQERSSRSFWLRIVSMVPAALAANVLRVLSLIAYRMLAYPGIESPQTHYFIGFLWLVPFVALITPKDHRPRSAGIMETLQAAAVVSLLAPMSGTPNAELVTLAAVTWLSRCRVRETSAWLLLAWIASGIGVAIVSMESFWLPWLLLCPLLVNWRQLRVPAIICLACAHSLIAMQPWAWWLATAGLATAWLSGRGVTPTNRDARHESLQYPSLTEQGAFFAALALPFLASTLLSLGQESWKPPVSVEARSMNQNGYEIRLHGQPDHIGLACYVAASRDRHHTVKVCLKYRGIEVVSVENCPLVFTAGRHWFREFFLQDQALLPDYSAYVQRTFRPWSDPGVHLIFVSLREKQSASEFSAACEQLAHQFHQQCLHHPTIAQQ
ncbi:MAG: hypothetical protein B7Z37_04575 [Verrucomicrobia bacterium 12-59-8]|nr:MAG: hypothetical protein B7Z37_04575 [Verrucomicrobia bacterium 12-59-8]